MVNVGKCSAITYTRNKSDETRNYQMGDAMLKKVNEVRDLGVDFASNLSFKSHINRVTSNAMRVLGFIKRFSKDFKDPNVMRILYCALVRPHLEYCSVVWSPFTADGKERIESVQHKFTNFACKRMIPQRDLTYDQRCQYLNLETLVKRRTNAGHIFVANALSGKIDCNQLLSLFHLNVSSHGARKPSVLREDKNHRTDYGKNNPLSRIIRNFKDVQDEFDYHLTKESFLTRIKR